MANTERHNCPMQNWFFIILQDCNWQTLTSDASIDRQNPNFLSNNKKL